MLTRTLRPSHVSFACLWSPELGAAATNWVLDRHPCTVPCWEDRACCNERSTFGSNRWYGREEERREKPKGTESVRRWAGLSGGWDLRPVIRMCGRGARDGIADGARRAVRRDQQRWRWGTKEQGELGPVGATGPVPDGAAQRHAWRMGGGGERVCRPGDWGWIWLTVCEGLWSSEPAKLRIWRPGPRCETLDVGRREPVVVSRIAGGSARSPGGVGEVVGRRECGTVVAMLCSSQFSALAEIAVSTRPCKALNGVEFLSPGKVVCFGFFDQQAVCCVSVFNEFFPLHHQSLRLSQPNNCADRQHARIHHAVSDMMLVTRKGRYGCCFWALHGLSGVPIGALLAVL